MRLLLTLIIALIFFLYGTHRAAFAQNASTSRATRPTTLRVATRIVPPFVMQEDQKLSGFSIDLWDVISRERGTQSQFVVKGTVKELLQTVESKQADVGIAAISVTSDRAKVLEFSQPMFDAGLQILVRDQNGGNSTPGILQVLLSRALGQTLLIVALIVLIPAHIIWLIERHHDEGIIENKSYFPGIFKAIWWAAGTLGAQADEMPRSPLGRLVAVFWMFTGIAFVAYFTAVITTAMTVQRLQGDINGPDDLPGKRVATVAGSTSEKYLIERDLRPQRFVQFADAARALEAGSVQAVVFDAPVLLYYSANEGEGKVHVVGTIFRRESYGIAFPAGSPWHRRVNYALLRLRESGEYEEIYKKWFGTQQGE